MHLFFHLRQLRVWLLIKRLELQVRRSERFQENCEEISCSILAELERKHRTEIMEKIARLKATLNAKPGMEITTPNHESANY